MFLNGRDAAKLGPVVAEVEKLQVRDVLEEKVDTFFESGNGRVNWRFLPASNEVIWFSQRDNWGQLYLYDLASGKLKNQITTGDGNVTQLLRVDERVFQRLHPPHRLIDEGAAVVAVVFQFRAGERRRARQCHVLILDDLTAKATDWETERLTLLMDDIVARVPTLSFIDTRRVLVFARAGRTEAEGAGRTRDAARQLARRRPRDPAGGVGRGRRRSSGTARGR